MTRSNPSGLWPRVSEQVEGKWQVSRVATCAYCGAEGRLPDNTRGGLPPEAVANKFRQRGWVVSGLTATCPTCANPKPKLQIVQTTEETEPVTSIPAKAEQPRSPSPAERRLIFDALEVHYDIDAGRFKQAHSDASIAAKLNVPRAWVEEVRKNLFGEGSGNEAGIVRDKQIADLTAALAALTDEFMTRAGEIEKAIDRLKVDASYSGGR